MTGFTSVRKLIFAGAVMALIAGCLPPNANPNAGETPVLVIGAPTPTGSSTLQSEAPPASSETSLVPAPSASPSPSGRPLPTPRPGLYAGPGWNWLVVGDTLLYRTFRSAVAWNTSWEELFLMEPPKSVNEAVSSELSSAGLERLDKTLDKVLAGTATYKYVGLCYGTTDCTRKVPVATFKRNLEAMVTKIRARGLEPVMSTIPYGTQKTLATLEDYNRAVIQVRTAMGVTEGPDLYRLVQDDLTLLDPATGLGMTSDGYAVLSRAWVQTLGNLIDGISGTDLAAPQTP